MMFMEKQQVVGAVNDRFRRNPLPTASKSIIRVAIPRPQLLMLKLTNSTLNMTALTFSSQQCLLADDLRLRDAKLLPKLSCMSRLQVTLASRLHAHNFCSTVCLLSALCQYSESLSTLREPRGKAHRVK